MSKEGTTRHKQILGITIRDTTVEKLEKDLKEYSVYNDYCPYVLDDEGHIKYADDYLTEDMAPDKKLIEIKQDYADVYLSEEISNAGMDDTFRKYDWRSLIEKLEKVVWPKIPDTQRIVVNVIYYCSYDHYSGGYDYEGEVEVIGYMNSELEIIRIK